MTGTDTALKRLPINPRAAMLASSCGYGEGITTWACFDRVWRVLCVCGEVRWGVVWCGGGWYGGVVAWWRGGAAVWRCGGVAVWWCDVLSAVCCTVCFVLCVCGVVWCGSESWCVMVCLGSSSDQQCAQFCRKYLAFGSMARNWCYSTLSLPPPPRHTHTRAAEIVSAVFSENDE